MSAIDRIVTLNITADTLTTPRAGFGKPMFAAFHTLFGGAERTRDYATLADAVTDGVVVGTVVHRGLQRMFAQSPRPTLVTLGRRALSTIQKIKITPIFVAAANEGFIYSYLFTLPDGTFKTATYTVVALDVVEDVVDGLKIAIDALALGGTTADNVTDLEYTAAAGGALLDIKDNNFRTGEGNSTIKDTSVDPGIATDLTAIAAYDDTWYGLAIDSNSEAEVLGAATWAEGEFVQFGANTYDSEVYDGAVSDDLFSDLTTAARARTFGVFGDSLMSNHGVAMVARRAPFTPGEFNLYLKTLGGSNGVALNNSRQGNVRTKRGNVYVEMGGANGVQDAKAFDNNFIDLQPLLDFLFTNIQASVLDVIRGPNVFPYTDQSVSTVKGAILGVLIERESKGLLKDSSTVTAPLVATVSTANKSNRVLPDVAFQTIAEGAIHQVLINGVVSL